MTYKERVMAYTSDLVDRYGGLRKAAREFRMDPALLCKFKNGFYTPKPQTLLKYFPDFDFSDCSDFSFSTSINRTEVIINCQELEELKQKLESIGYELRYSIIKRRPIN